MATLWEECFSKEMAASQEANRDTVEFSDVDELAVQFSKKLVSDGGGKYHLLVPAKPRKPRRDKGVSKTKPAEEWTRPTPESA